MGAVAQILAVVVGVAAAAWLARLVLRLQQGWRVGGPAAVVPVSVNYHFTRRCNKTCGFCFHTATTSHMETVARAQQALRLLQEAGMRKINFAGGEPFLYPSFLGEMVAFCKGELRLESVSIVTNGSRVRRQFLQAHARHIDILAVSCDSFDPATNVAIGRGDARGEQLVRLFEIAGWCRELRIKFKLNTVVNRLNHAEDMNAAIQRLQPFRWKCFQVLIVDGENAVAKTSPAADGAKDHQDDKPEKSEKPDNLAKQPLRNGHDFTVSDDQFDRFCQRHRGQPSLVPEPNRLMAKSYLILDEYLRFLDRTGRAPSQPIVEVGVQQALRSVFWDEAAFLERGGIYDWKKEDEQGCGTAQSKDLDW